MAACPTCKREMLSADGCTTQPMLIGGKVYKQVPYGKETRYGEGFPAAAPERCHDCSAKKGEFHHPGCDTEECPKCHRQIIGCDCDIKVFGEAELA